MNHMKFPKGLHEYRFKDNPEEKRFAEAWRDQNKHGDNLAYLLDERKEAGSSRPLTPSDRDYVVAATVMQWLGSPVGQWFLRDLGYTKVGPFIDFANAVAKQLGYEENCWEAVAASDAILGDMVRDIRILKRRAVRKKT